MIRVCTYACGVGKETTLLFLCVVYAYLGTHRYVYDTLSAQHSSPDPTLHVSCPRFVRVPRWQAVSLSALAKADVMQVPKPLHLGVLPK